MNYQLIANQSELNAAVSHLRSAGHLAVDMEMENNLHHYGLHLALVQVATPANDIFIFDPVELADLRPLGALLTDSQQELIMHAADFDRRTCFQLRGWILNPIFDTQIAAMFCGFNQISLANLLGHLFGVKMDKRFQKQDWLRRPLAKPALEYAVRDVNMLHALREHLRARLMELKRLEWAKEEMQLAGRGIFENCPVAPCCRIKHSSGLSPRQLATLKSLVHFRETVARDLDRPVHFIVRDPMLIELVRHAPQDETAVRSIKGLHPALYRKNLAGQLIKAIQSGLAAPAETHPAWHARRQAYPAAGWEERLKAMRAWRISLAHELKLEPHLLLDGEIIHWCARHPCQKLPPLVAQCLRNWQRHLLWPDFQKQFNLDC